MGLFFGAVNILISLESRACAAQGRVATRSGFIRDQGTTCLGVFAVGCGRIILRASQLRVRRAVSVNVRNLRLRVSSGFLTEVPVTWRNRSLSRLFGFPL
jgi:hypothetical protein